MAKAFNVEASITRTLLDTASDDSALFYFSCFSTRREIKTKARFKIQTGERRPVIPFVCIYSRNWQERRMIHDVGSFFVCTWLFIRVGRSFIRPSSAFWRQIDDEKTEVSATWAALAKACVTLSELFDASTCVEIPGKRFVKNKQHRFDWKIPETFDGSIRSCGRCELMLVRVGIRRKMVINFQADISRWFITYFIS